LSNQRANYSFKVITLSLILLGSGFLGSIPYVMADEDDDKKEKLQKLKAIVAKLLEDEKCPDKFFKYGEICDKEKPEIEIKEPDQGDRLEQGVITFEIKAKDKQTGIKMVELSINNGPFQNVPLSSGDRYILDVPLNDPGRIKATAKATDNAGNFRLDRVNFKINPI